MVLMSMLLNDIVANVSGIDVHVHTVCMLQSLECLNSVPADNRLHHILNELRDKCRKQRLLVYPYFKDYDRVSSCVYLCFSSLV